jgi:hypothetical protein|tara:strand:- start:944 stop:1498 length:555 start_codon:yes stop_codon:yes gene_type:complete
MANIFGPIKDRQAGVLKSASWYRGAVQNMTNKATSNTLMRQGKLNQRPSAGRLNMYFYDPKTKKKLPYYDIFPLVLPVDTFTGGFVGLNFHYLPYALRFKLLQEIQRYASNTQFDRTTRINATYSTLKNIPLIKPTIKKYLWKHVRSNFLRIDADEMAIAVYLPLQQFKKATPSKVYADSRRAI